jgi:hypothetical protein
MQAVQKWSKRSRATKATRARAKMLDKSYLVSVVKSTFKGWQTQTFLSKQFMRAVSNFGTLMDRIQIFKGFTVVKHNSILKSTRAYNNQE